MAAVVHVWNPDPICGAPPIDTHPGCRSEKGYRVGLLTSPYPFVVAQTPYCPSCGLAICADCRAALAAIPLPGERFGMTGGLLRVVSC